MYTHAYFVPTHRRISDIASERHFREVAHARARGGVDLPLVVVDEGETNRAALLERSLNFPGVPCYYFTPHQVAAIYGTIAARLADAERRALEQLYPDGHVNYGNVYNKLYVLAAVLGARQLHRRDSDTYAQVVLQNEEEAELFPIELEMQLLGRPVNGRPILLAGGGYAGQWSIDIDHLITDPDTRDLRKFFNCLSIPEHEHEVALQEHILGNNLPYQEDRVELDSDKEPDCGNMAMRELFEYLPCSPVRYALGGDYFTFACMIEAGFARAYHNRAVLHAYTPCRYDNWEKLVGYWRSTAALVVYQDFYRAYYCSLRPLARARLDGKSVPALAQLVVSSMHAFREEFLRRAGTVRGRLHDFYEVIGKRGDPLLLRALEEIRADEGSLIALIQGSVQQHLQLIESWKAIIDAAKEVSGSAAVARAIDGARLS